MVDFAVPADYRVKLKEREKKGKCFYFVRELNKRWNWYSWYSHQRIGTLGTVTKGLVKWLKGLEIRV